MRIKFDDRKMRMLLYDKKLTQTKVSELCKICEALGIDIHEYATFNRF